MPVLRTDIASKVCITQGQWYCLALISFHSEILSGSGAPALKCFTPSPLPSHSPQLATEERIFFAGA